MRCVDDGHSAGGGREAGQVDHRRGRVVADVERPAHSRECGHVDDRRRRPDDREIAIDAGHARDQDRVQRRISGDGQRAADRRQAAHVDALQREVAGDGDVAADALQGTEVDDDELVVAGERDIEPDAGRVRYQEILAAVDVDHENAADHHIYAVKNPLQGPRLDDQVVGQRRRHDCADAVVVGVGDEERGSPDVQTPDIREGGVQRGAAVAGETVGAGTREDREDAGAEIDLEDLTEIRDVEVVGIIDGEALNVAEGHGRRSAEARRDDAAACNRGDDVGDGVDATHGVGSGFGQEQVAGGIRGHVSGRAETRRQRVAAIPVRSAIVGQAGASHPGNDMGDDVHLAHGAVHELDEIHVAGRVDRYSKGYPDPGVRRRATVALVADVIQATACEGGDHAAGEIDLAQPVHAAVRDVEDVVRRAERDGLD